MDAIVLDRFGGVEELTQRRIRVPEVGDSDVLVRVQAAGVGSWDQEERAGDYAPYFEAGGLHSSFPYVLGWDAAGTVAAVGSAVSGFAPGDRVYAATIPVPRGGCYAEYVVVEADFVAQVPASLPTDQAGALPWDALTAQSGLDVLNQQRGQTVMILGASGGIGHLAVQLARQRGWRVLAVASGDDGVDLTQRLGAHESVDGRRRDVVDALRTVAPDGVDAALVIVGGEAGAKAMAAVKPEGRVAIPNGVAPIPDDRPNRDVTMFDGDRSRRATDRLNTSIDRGPFRVHLAEKFTRSQLSDAHRALQRHYLGKLVTVDQQEARPG
jgi:NADPH:quinone reductase-like Zn-dependent oxidoreductase